MGLPVFTRYRDVVGMLSHLSVSSCFFSDVLCPSVRVEGDRFKHTNGGSKEITGKSDSNRQDCFRVQHATPRGFLPDSSLILGCHQCPGGMVRTVQVAVIPQHGGASVSSFPFGGLGPS